MSVRAHPPPPHGSDHPYVAISASPSDCVDLDLSIECHPGSPMQFACLQRLNQRHAVSAGGLRPRAYAVYANAQFAVTRDRIQKRSQTFYEKLLADFEIDDADACFRVPTAVERSGAERRSPPQRVRPHRGTCLLLEYLWPSILGEPPILDPRRTMIGERSDGPHKQGGGMHKP